MQNVDVVIRKRLMELCPHLRLDGFDRLVWGWCGEDMFLYLQYLKEYREEFAGHIRYMEVYYFGKILVGLQGLFNIQIMAQEYDAEVNEWMNMWIGLWWKKFQQRVKLNLEPKKKRMLKTEKEGNKGRSIWNNKLNQKEREHIFKSSIKTLFENGEIVRPEVIARHNINLRLSQKMKDKKEWKAEDSINFAKSLRDNLKHLSHTHGPLLFVFPSKRAYMAEWRENGESTT
jgi:hypothetical protein